MKRKMNRIWRQATADKKKFGLFLTTAAIGLLLWGRLILLEDVPKMATANDPAVTGSSNSTPKDLASSSTDPPLDLPSLQEVSVTLSEDLPLNLFAFRHNRYKPLPASESLPDLSQLPSSTDDERRQALVELARSLRLQSVMQGNSSVIVINGELLRTGDSIEGFEILSFNERSVKLSREGLTFLLKMQSK